MKWLSAFERGVRRLSTSVGRLVSWLLVPLMLITVFDVVARRYFQVGSVALQELEWHLHAIVFLLSLAYTYQVDGHVRIDILRERLSERTRIRIEALGSLMLLAPFSFVVAWLGFEFWQYSWRVDEVSSSPGGLPARWAIKAFLPLGFVLLFLQGLAVFVGSVLELARMRSGE